MDFRLMQVLSEIRELQQVVAQTKASGRRIALVPTMGALHDGHLSLVDLARRQADFVLATIFVNPTQFAPTEDLARYPRTLMADLDALRERGVDAVFTPAENQIYPPGFSTYVDPPDIARRWEGHFRPTHFRGVATVVLKLLNLTQADCAIFGQKDYQQATVIRRMVHDLNVNCTIVLAPIIRDPDGLAMSSRNRYLSSDERRRALAIRRTLLLARQSVLDKQVKSGFELSDQMRHSLTSGGVTELDYAAAVDPETLEPLEVLTLPLVVLIAARVGSTRLIDNERVEGNS